MHDRLSVLVVENDPETSIAISLHLERAGFDVTRVASAEEALDIAALDPDAVVSELRLPGSSGLELLAAMQDKGLRPRTVFLTALPTYHDCRRAWKLGAVDVLSKPADLDDLVRSVRSGRTSPASAETPDELDLAGSTTAPDISLALREVLAFAVRCGAAPASRARLGTAVAEVLDNVRRHAYDGALGGFRLRASHRDGQIEVHVRDEGTGFDSVQARLDATPAALPFGSAETGGLSHVAALVEGLSIESSEGGTRVTLRVSTRPSTFECEATTDLSELDLLDPRTTQYVLRAIETGESTEMLNLPPALAVVIGRLLAGPSPSQLEQTSLWS